MVECHASVKAFNGTMYVVILSRHFNRVLGAAISQYLFGKIPLPITVCGFAHSRMQLKKHIFRRGKCLGCKVTTAWRVSRPCTDRSYAMSRWCKTGAPRSCKNRKGIYLGPSEPVFSTFRLCIHIRENVNAQRRSNVGHRMVSKRRFNEKIFKPTSSSASFDLHASDNYASSLFCRIRCSSPPPRFQTKMKMLLLRHIRQLISLLRSGTPLSQSSRGLR